jgi:hypothetical protein
MVREQIKQSHLFKQRICGPEQVVILDNGFNGSKIGAGILFNAALLSVEITGYIDTAPSNRASCFVEPAIRKLAARVR